MEDVVGTVSFSDRQKFFARVSDTAFWDVHSKNSFVLIAVFMFNLSDESVAEPQFIPALDPLSHPARR